MSVGGRPDTWHDPAGGSAYQGEPTADPDAPEAAALATERWAAGYTFASKPTLGSYNPSGDQSYNRSGQRIVITKPAGTTGRYVVTLPRSLRDDRGQEHRPRDRRPGYRGLLCADGRNTGDR